MVKRGVYGAVSGQRSLESSRAWSLVTYAAACCSVIVPAFCQSESILQTRSRTPNMKNIIINNLSLTDITTMKSTLTRNHSYTINPELLHNKEDSRNNVLQSDNGLIKILEDNEVDKSAAGDIYEDLLVGYPNKPYELSVPWRRYKHNNRQEDSREKRGVVHLYNMISCATGGCDPIAYKGYGCYCGFLGSGRVIDGIDRCCKMHDHCYESVHCPSFTVYFQPYLWRCFGRQPLCALENRVTSHPLVGAGCAARLCDCDRALALCLSRFHCPEERALCRSSPLRLLQNLLMVY